MLHEGVHHTRTWMAWPDAGDQFDGSAAELDEARDAWSAVANTISEFESLTMLVPATERDAASRRLSSQIELIDAEIDDGWLRDSGPTFVIDDAGELGAVDWVFNGWGARWEFPWAKDAAIAPAIAEQAGATRIDSPLTNEGGGIHVDGEGTILLTKTVQLGRERNPGWTAEQVEAELARTLGVGRAIWLPYGLWRDEQQYGTNGHVDIVACFAEPGVVIVHDQRDASHPDFERSRVFREVLGASRDAVGRELRIIDLPAPERLRDAEGYVDYSYVNHSLVNGGVIACSFGDAADANAKAILADAYPGREVVTVDARPIFARGGGIHCITQHEPAVPAR